MLEELSRSSVRRTLEESLRALPFHDAFAAPDLAAEPVVLGNIEVTGTTFVVDMLLLGVVNPTSLPPHRQTVPPHLP